MKSLSAFKNDAGFADMFDEMLLINQSKVSYFWNGGTTVDFPSPEKFYNSDFHRQLSSWGRESVFSIFSLTMIYS